MSTTTDIVLIAGIGFVGYLAYKKFKQTGQSLRTYAGGNLTNIVNPVSDHNVAYQTANAVLSTPNSSIGSDYYDAVSRRITSVSDYFAAGPLAPISLWQTLTDSDYGQPWNPRSPNYDPNATKPVAPVTRANVFYGKTAGFA